MRISQAANRVTTTTNSMASKGTTATTTTATAATEEKKEALFPDYRHILSCYFAQSDGKQIVSHQIESFNQFIEVDIPEIIHMANPISSRGSPEIPLAGPRSALATATGLSTTAANALMGGAADGPTHLGKRVQHEYEVTLEFEKISIRKPTIFENNGAIHPMMPNDARLRNLTYAAPLNIDVKVTTTFIDHTRNGIRESNVRIFPNVHLGKIPVMVGSKYCLLHDQRHVHPSAMGECPEDLGGYFIVQGGERAMISMERMSENRPFVFRNGRGSAKEQEVVEIKCIGPDNDQVPKSNTVKIVYHPKNQLITMLRATVPRIKTDIPLFILFRALGVLPDRDACELILGKDEEPTYDTVLTESILEAREVRTQEDALGWLAEHTNTWSVKSQKQGNVADILAEELFPQIGGHEMNYEKACFLAHMTRKVLWTSSKRLPTDDRDAYPNKRVDIPGFLLADLFRKTYNNRMVKDMKAALSKEIHGGSWKATGNWSEIVNINNINKIIKSTIMDVCLKSSLATGNFGSGKIGGPNKVGVSQVLNRLNYSATISHLRRISTPIEKTGKLIAPRKQHGSQWGLCCPCETPEGHGVGVIKNMSITSTVSIFSSPVTVYTFLQGLDRLLPLKAASIEELHSCTRVFLNGSWIGVLRSEDTAWVVDQLRQAKRSGKLHMYTGIVWKSAFKELWMTTEAGRILRPLYCAPAVREVMRDRSGVLRDQMLAIQDWNQLLLWRSPSGHHLVEYVDAGETDAAYIAMDYPSCLKDESYTHCEIHPSVIFGTTASYIPFPDHNQSPRNAYQCLWEEEEVLMASGVRKPIKDVRVGEKVVSFDPVTGRMEPVEVVNQYVRETEKKIYKLTTVSGRTVVATDNHPFITESGWMSVAELVDSPNRKLGVVPNWVFADTNVPEGRIAVSREEMEAMLRTYEVEESLITRHLMVLESVGLCPLMADDKRLPMLARMLGFIQTDGSINVYAKKNYRMCQVACDFGEKEDAKTFEMEIASLGFQSCSITKRVATIHGYRMTTYHICHNGAFASLIACLGATLGRNTEVMRLPVPQWIMTGSDNVKREFLGGFQGGDGCKIRHNRTNGNQNFVCAETSNQICLDHKDSLATFMSQIQSLFEYFGVESKVVERMNPRAQPNRYTVGVKLADKSDNLIRLYDRIGYRYDTRKIVDSFKTVEYLKYKSRLVDEYVSGVQAVRESIAQGLTRKEIAIHHNLSMSCIAAIERSMKNGREITMRRLEEHEYCDVICEQMTHRGRMIFVPIESIVEHERVRIADITVANEHHSFITSHNIGSHNSSMGKQAMGIYSLNFRQRFDAMAHVLCYPEKPMVSSYMSRIFGAESLPAGQNVIVAIMTYTGYNQEDSNMINRAALDRGRFRSIFYRTYKDEERKNQSSGEEEKFCRPDPTETKHMKNAHYDKVAEDGFIPKDTFVTPDDILIGKVVPLRVPTGTVLPAGAKKSRDVSKMPRNNESGYVDKIYKNRNGEGYSFVKIRMRQDRVPEIGDKFCLTADHDVLTRRRGWIPIPEVTMEDEVAQLNRETGFMEYVRPLETLLFDHEGEMYEVESQGVSLKTTLNHRMWVQRRGKEAYELVEAKEIVGKRVRYQCDGPVAYEEGEFKLGEEVFAGETMDALLMILGIWMAEGWVYLSPKDYLYRLEFAANKPRVQSALQEACDVLGFKSNLVESTLKFYINHRELAEYMSVFSVGATNKYIPEWVFQLSSRQARLFLHAMCLGDGHETETSLHYCTSSIRLRDDVQILCQHAGYTAYYVKRYDAGHSITMSDGRVLTTTADNWDIGIRRTRVRPTINHGHAKTQSGQKEEITSYSGKVYCLRVPTEVFLVRRNGRVVWTGNSSRHG
jgi:DNA-directed RNA polymerase beta subunit